MLTFAPHDDLVVTLIIFRAVLLLKRLSTCFDHLIFNILYDFHDGKLQPF